MTLRCRLAALLAWSAVAASLTTCSVAPAYADPETPVPAEAGTADGGWTRVACHGTVGDQRCGLRFPEGFRRLDVTYVHGRHQLGTGSTFDYDTPPRVRDRIRRWKGRPVSGVAVKCMTVGGLVSCTVHILARVRVYEDTYYSAGVDQGGIIYEADALPAT